MLFRFLTLFFILSFSHAGMALAQSGIDANPAPKAEATPAVQPPLSANPTTTATPTPQLQPYQYPVQSAVSPSTNMAYTFYCEKTNAYYPTVTICAEGWIAIPMGQPVAARPWVGAVPFYPNSVEAVEERPNVLSIELLGRALVYSLDYDRAISSHVTLGLGISSWQASAWWNNYTATVTVVPVYLNFYFSESPSRGYLTGGADWISVTQSGNNSNVFNNNGVAAVFGGGYESRSNEGFIFRASIYVIAGQSISVQPALSLGYAF